MPTTTPPAVTLLLATKPQYINQPTIPSVPLVPHRSSRIPILSAGTVNAQITEEITDQALAQNEDWAHDGTPTAFSAIHEDGESWDWGNNLPSLAFASEADGSRYHWFPTSYAEAMTRPDLWKAPMDKEMQSMKDHGVWTLVKRPMGTRMMKNRWVFANKYDTEGAIEARKAWLVAKGFTQIPGIDYFFYLRLCHPIRIPTAKSSGRNRHEHGNLAGGLLEHLPQCTEPSINQPEGYQITIEEFEEVARNRGLGEHDENDDKAGDEWEIVARLTKGLYGTMSGGYDWWVVLDKDMQRLGYKRSWADQSVRSHLVGTERTIMGTYTDDVSGMSTTVAGSIRARKELGEKFKVRDLGDIHLILAIRVERDRIKGVLMMSQGEYLNRILERHGMHDCAPKYTPLPPGIILTAATSPLSGDEKIFMADKLYKTILGGIMYAQVSMRPDLSFCVALLSRFSSNPNKSHW